MSARADDIRKAQLAAQKCVQRGDIAGAERVWKRFANLTEPMSDRIPFAELRAKAERSIVYPLNRDECLALLEAVEASHAYFDETLADEDVADESVVREARAVDALARFDFGDAS